MRDPAEIAGRRLAQANPAVDGFRRVENVPRLAHRSDQSRARILVDPPEHRLHLLARPRSSRANAFFPEAVSESGRRLP
jgi:hypothetical protein